MKKIFFSPIAIFTLFVTFPLCCMQPPAPTSASIATMSDVTAASSSASQTTSSSAASSASVQAAPAPAPQESNDPDIAHILPAGPLQKILSHPDYLAPSMLSPTHFINSIERLLIFISKYGRADVEKTAHEILKRRLELIDPKTISDEYGSIIHATLIRKKSLPFFKMLLELIKNQPAFLTITDSMGKTPLHLAARAHSPEVTALIFAQTPKQTPTAALTTFDHSGMSVLHYAAENPNAGVFQFLVQQIPAGEKALLRKAFISNEESRKSVLTWALRRGTLGAVKCIMENIGEKIRTAILLPQGKPNRKIFCDANRNENPAVGLYLLSLLPIDKRYEALTIFKVPVRQLDRIPVEERCDDKAFFVIPLHQAARSADPTLTKELFNLLSEETSTPHLEEWRTYWIGKLLINSLTVDNPETSLSLWKIFLHGLIRNNYEIQEYGTTFEKLSSEIGIEWLNTPDKQGNTPLHIAALHGNEKIVKKLVFAGADPTIKNREGYTAYDYVLERQQGESEEKKSEAHAERKLEADQAPHKTAQSTESLAPASLDPQRPQARPKTPPYPVTPGWATLFSFFASGSASSGASSIPR